MAEYFARYAAAREEGYPDVICAAAGAYGAELQSLLEQETGRPVPLYLAGASIAINAGPKIAAIYLLGEKRRAE